MHHRKTPRAQRYNYTNPGGYFITICTKDRVQYFGEINDGKMILNDLGIVCDRMIAQLGQRKSVDIHDWVVMPNHVHMILIMGEFTDAMNTGYIMSHDIDGTDDNVHRRDALAGRHDINHNENDRTRNDENHRTRNDENHRTRNERVPTHERVPTVIKNDDYQGPTLGNIINTFKGNVSKYAKQIDMPFARQPRYHDRIIRDQGEYERISHYIQANPENRGKDTLYES